MTDNKTTTNKTESLKKLKKKVKSMPDGKKKSELLKDIEQKENKTVLK